MKKTSLEMPVAPVSFLWRGLLLEYITLNWNVVGVIIVVSAAYLAHSVAELLVLHHDMLKLIDGAVPDTLAQDQSKAESANVNEQEPERQTVPEQDVPHPAKTVETAETVQEQEPSPKTANCTFSGELVLIDLKRFADRSISLVECPHCGRMRSFSSNKGILRFKLHTRRKQQTPLAEKRWSATGKADWSVVGN
jgi:hypothetical protein